LAQGLAQVYRLRKNTDYLYTTDVVEMSGARAAGYVVEGPTWKLYQEAASGRMPLYRCMVGPTHFLSKESNCEGWTMEGVMGYGLSAAVSGSADLIRFYAPSTGAHIALLSTDTAEINSMPSYGFQREGVLTSLPSW
jgi:hypothetical protein